MYCTHDFDSFQHKASKRRARSTTNVGEEAGIDESSCTVIAGLRYMRCYSIKRQAFGVNVRARNSVPVSVGWRVNQITCILLRSGPLRVTRPQHCDMIVSLAHRT